LFNEIIQRIALNYEQAIKYLQKKDLKLQDINTGWQLVSYQGYILGWINVLPNRINNYYPKELRILKEPPFPPAGGED
jgi:NOL1/NOP2/fmu family ribosome biogenesis protein